MFYKMMFCKIFCKIFLSFFPSNDNVLYVFLSRIQKYRIFIARDQCFLIISFAITVSIMLSVNTCVMGFGWPICSNVFRRIMTYLPVTKHPPVSAYEEEGPTNFNILQFTCVGPFECSRVHFEVLLHKKNVLQCDCTLLVQSDIMHRCLRVKSCLKC